MNDLVDYRKLVYAAMCGVVKDALGVFSKLSPSRDIHVAISFLTGCAGVVLPEYLKARYPESMTIVLQYQFHNLLVSEVGFSVTLSFREKEESIMVPFRSIVRYVDMLANFSLDLGQYSDVELDVVDDGPSSVDTFGAHSSEGNIIFIDKFLKS